MCLRKRETPLLCNALVLLLRANIKSSSMLSIHFFVAMLGRIIIVNERDEDDRDPEMWGLL